MAEHTDNRYHQIKKTLEDHHKKIISEFNTKHKHTIKKITDKGISLAGAAIIVSSVMAASPASLRSTDMDSRFERVGSVETGNKIKEIINKKSVLNEYQETQIQNLLSEQFNLNLKVTLNGNRLNEIYGYTGQEQHLIRWAGDNLSKHEHPEYGMAPLKGAFGYFDNEDQEKYYIAAQIHELPNWNEDWPTLKPWYRFRKVFVYNPDNNKAVIAVIGDAGPSKWTSKTFGGSPEVMRHLERVDGGKKGKIIVLFIDDEQNKIALGPVNPETYLAKK